MYSVTSSDCPAQVPAFRPSATGSGERPRPAISESALDLGALVLAIVLVLGGTQCRGGLNLGPMSKDPLFESFFEKASLIMTDEEIEVYKSLADTDSKAAFVEEFWRSRDMDHSTEENEGRAEFERRVRFANTWFDERQSPEAKTGAPGEEADRGWSSDPGRVYIILGPPDLVTGTNGTDGILEPFDPIRLYRDDDLSQADRTVFRRSMTWIYARPRDVLRVHFSQSGGRWYTNVYASRRGREALEEAKLNYLAEDLSGWKRGPFRFRVKCVPGAIEFRVPKSLVTYVEEGKNLVASLRVRLVIYRNGQRESVSEKIQGFTLTEDELPAAKNLEFVVPWRPAEKGRYLLDITISDLKSLRIAAFRTFLKKTI